jgi:hypothetical protein
MFEEGYDGVCIVPHKEGAHISLVSQSAIDRTARCTETALP